MHYSAYSGLELLDSAVLVLDHAWRIVYLNPAAESLFELSQRLAAGLSLEQAFPNDGKALLQAATLARRNNTSFIEHDLKLLTASHNELHLSCNATPLESGNAALLIEFRPIDQQIKIANEERILVQQQANRELIRNLAHEIKNPLGGIRGAAQLLERELVRRELTEYTQVIIQEAERLQSLIDRLLTPHRIPQVAEVNIHEVLERVRSVLLAETPTGLKIRRDYDTSLPPLTGDKEQLIQVMLNIARNAVQAMQGQGEIILRTRVTRQVTLARKRHRLAMLVQIIDNGPGIPDAIRDNIFYPLVSGRADGTGLGLTLAQTYIHQHHGAIDFDSKPGHTSFNILLPLTQEN
ncbi:MAG: two-component system, NtrC family, nitrogen regulation sensor histidine kinase GlnL [Pseudomonadota bacterium]|jgi:two-component system nitrogen regulation sensor histidine kinase GlnL|nr:two-component system, NtrC family, nitrogen regulation sensor histidine kinase GlnL [Pseudomonadota bacterium]MDQ5904182.1 two-component system, NtrC family, nitrogen regulation sensor histidine kinase GlnL [Pseudomonadota bacterium]